MQSNPELDEELVRDLAWDYANAIYADGSQMAKKYSYGQLLAWGKAKLLSYYDYAMKHRVKTVPLDEVKDMADPTENLVEECLERVLLTEMIDLLHKRLESINENHKRVVYLTEFSRNGHGMAKSEVAKLLGISVSRVNEILRNVIKNLSRTEFTAKEALINSLYSQGYPVKNIAAIAKTEKSCVEHALDRAGKINLSKKLKDDLESL